MAFILFLDFLKNVYDRTDIVSHEFILVSVALDGGQDQWHSAMGLWREHDHQFPPGRASHFKLGERRDRFRQRHSASDLWNELALLGCLGDACHTLRCWLAGCQGMPQRE